MIKFSFQSAVRYSPNTLQVTAVSSIQRLARTIAEFTEKLEMKVLLLCHFLHVAFIVTLR